LLLLMLLLLFLLLLLSSSLSFYTESVRWADSLSKQFCHVCSKYMQTLHRLMANS
jgi:hypothetical protein